MTSLLLLIGSRLPLSLQAVLGSSSFLRETPRPEVDFSIYHAQFLGKFLSGVMIVFLTMCALLLAFFFARIGAFRFVISLFSIEPD